MHTNSSLSILVLHINAKNKQFINQYYTHTGSIHDYILVSVLYAQYEHTEIEPLSLLRFTAELNKLGRIIHSITAEYAFGLKEQ